MKILLFTATVLYFEGSREALQNMFAWASVYTYQNHWSIVGATTMIAVVCAFAMFIDYDAVRRMFVSPKLVGNFESKKAHRQSSAVWALFRVGNWFISAAFVFLLLRVFPGDNSAGLRSVPAATSSTVSACFIAWCYLLLSFRVSTDVTRWVEGDESKRKAGEAKKRELSSSSSPMLIPGLFHIVATAFTLYRVAADENPDKMLAALVMGGSTVAWGTSSLVSRALWLGERDFDNTLAALVHTMSNSDSVLVAEQVEQSKNEYDSLFAGYDRSKPGSMDQSEQARRDHYDTLVNNFYDLVTDFYEYGWGQSFHFAPRFRQETFNESLRRAEYRLASLLGLEPGMKVLDMGCGIGGPMRAIARFSGADITGVTINAYQVRVGNKYNRQMGLDKTCRLIQGDFMKLPFPDNSFDAIFSIEAICHSPDKEALFREALRVLKPGAKLASYDWVMTDRYCADTPNHKRIREGIEIGNGLPPMPKGEIVLAAMTGAGFVDVRGEDVNAGWESKQEIPWFDSLDGKWTLRGFRMTRTGRLCTHLIVSLLELCRIAPKGSVRVSLMLNRTADDLVEGGKLGIFTPGYLSVGRKPKA